MGEKAPDWNPSSFGELAGTPTRGELYGVILEGVALDVPRHERPARDAGIELSETISFTST
jgi:sugar (pentulose or hexulose) kinase